MDTIITRDVSIPRLALVRSACRAACASLSSKARSRSAIAIFDTAAMYENQDAVGAAIAALPKDQRYVTRPSRPTGARRRFSSRTHPTFRRYACTQ